MATYFSPTGNPEVWDERPEGYLTPEEWDAAHPAPPPTPEEILASRRAEIQGRLDALDREYLTPRTLAEAAAGGSFALVRIQAHADAAAPLRAELKGL
jgi:hypothetical protein